MVSSDFFNSFRSLMFGRGNSRNSPREISTSHK